MQSNRRKAYVFQNYNCIIFSLLRKPKNKNQGIKYLGTIFKRNVTDDVYFES